MALPPLDHVARGLRAPVLSARPLARREREVMQYVPLKYTTTTALSTVESKVGARSQTSLERRAEPYPTDGTGLRD
eukprot:scaffold10980_cov125-Isochrysis_galbana.AAC.9